MIFWSPPARRDLANAVDACEQGVPIALVACFSRKKAGHSHQGNGLKVVAGLVVPFDWGRHVGTPSSWRMAEGLTGRGLAWAA